MKPLLLLLIVTLYSLRGLPQSKFQGMIKGQVMDGRNRRPLPNATVSLLHGQDSSLAATSYTDKNGMFTLVSLNKGDYLLHITYMGYLSLLRRVKLETSSTVEEMWNLALERTGVTLGIVEIKEMAPPIIIKKDTLEYRASSFKARDNAILEELLKKLPGIQVEKDGIKAMGETVKQILIDGKPFFGGNSKLTVESLPAEIVDKIQLMDYKSEQEKFTGIQGNETGKVINITIKEDSRGRLLGRATVGHGTNGRFATKASLNQLGQEQQLALVAAGNNVNNLGVNDSGGNHMRSAIDGNGGEGIAHLWNAALQYNDDRPAKWKLSGSYQLSGSRMENQRQSSRQNLLPDTIYYYNQHARTLNESRSHNLQMRALYSIDTLHSVIASSSINYGTGESLQDSHHQTMNGEHQLINSGKTLNNGSSSSPSFYSNLLFRKKFRKIGRTFTTGITYRYNDGQDRNINQTGNLFVMSDGNTFVDSLDQRSENNNYGHGITWQVTYTEPIFKNYFLQFTYSTTYSSKASYKHTFDYNATKQAYDLLNDSLSNSFDTHITTRQAGISLRTSKGNYNYVIGANLQTNDLTNDDISNQIQLQQHSLNFYPSASFKYSFSNNKLLKLYYAGNVEQPDISQLQPVPDNTNPLHIRLGNPDLSPAFHSIIGLSYNTFNTGNMSGIFANVAVEVLHNKIVSTSWFDSVGRQVSQPKNINGAYYLNGVIVYTSHLKGLAATLNTSTSFNMNRDISYNNGIMGHIRNTRLSQEVNLHYSYCDCGDITAAARVNYNTAAYSQQKESNIRFSTYSFSLDGNLNLGDGFIIGLDIDYMLNTGRTAGYNWGMLMLNANISKYIFKKRGLLKLQGFDLLNENIGVTRKVGENYIEDVQTKVLQRFLMLSFSYFLK